MDWMHLAQNRDQWRDLVNTVMNLWGSIRGEKFFDYQNDYYLLKKNSVP
jgi:hypothetical protein